MEIRDVISAPTPLPARPPETVYVLDIFHVPGSPSSLNASAYATPATDNITPASADKQILLFMRIYLSPLL
jgi:hypothetical protein